MRQQQRTDGSHGRLWLLAAALIAVFFSACGDADYQVVPVAGQVTLDGEPLRGVHVSFQPVAGDSKAPNPGPGSFGVTDDQGRYELRLVEPDGPGAVVGEHRVRLSKSEPGTPSQSDAGGPVESGLPPAATDGSLTVAVPEGGTDTADIALQSR